MVDNINKKTHYDFKPFTLSLISSFIITFLMSLYGYYFSWSWSYISVFLLISLYSLLITMFLVFFFNEEDYLFIHFSRFFNQMDFKSVKILTLLIECLIIFIINLIIGLPHYRIGLFLYVFLFIGFLVLWGHIENMIQHEEKIEIIANSKKDRDNYVFTYSNSGFSIEKSESSFIELKKETKPYKKVIVLFIVYLVIFFLNIFFYYHFGFYIFLIANIIYICYFVNSEKDKQTVKIKLNEKNQLNEFRFCSKCGTKLKKDDVFCKVCGTKLN